MSLVSDDTCVSISGRKITIVSDADAQGCPASLSVSVYALVDLGSSSLQSEPLTVSLLRFSSLELTLGAHPAGPSSVSELRLVECTSTY